MTAHAFSTTLFGVEAVLVDVETQILGALKRFTIVGLPDGVVREARDRVRGALEHAGIPFPYGEVIVSLSPATLPKAGAGFDLAIAVTILCSMGLFGPEVLRGRIFLGELGLDGTIRPVPGVLAAACCASSCSRPHQLVVATSTAAEALLAGDVAVLPVDSISELIAFLTGAKEITPLNPRGSAFIEQRAPEADFEDVIGQQEAKRALEVAAAGAHNLCMIGPPGAGKTMLAQRLRDVLPPLTPTEALEVTKIYAAYSARGVGAVERPTSLIHRRPFRAPHHTMTAAGLIGGGGVPMPGEISLAHRGVLFLDELPELRREALECLREPLETRTIAISRARFRIIFPADFMLVAAMNPCPCGKRGTDSISCRCSEPMLAKYLARISGPILDRIDLQIWVPPVPVAEFQRGATGSSAGVVERVGRARAAQSERLGNGARTNGSMSAAEVARWCEIDGGSRRLLERAGKRLRLSARAYTRVLKVARTVADLEGAGKIEQHHVAEALSYRAAEQL